MQAWMCLRNLEGLLSAGTIEKEKIRKRGIAWMLARDDLAAFAFLRKDSDRLAHGPWIELNARLGDVFDVGSDLPCSPLLLLGGKRARGTKDKDIVLHLLLLWLGALCKYRKAGGRKEKNEAEGKRRNYTPPSLAM